MTYGLKTRMTAEPADYFNVSGFNRGCHEQVNVNSLLIKLIFMIFR